MAPVSDRNLLQGMLALRLGVVDRYQLVTALRDVPSASQVSLAAKLVERGFLQPAEQTVLDLAVDHYLARHGDLAGSVAALETGITFEQLVRDLAESKLELDTSDAADAFRTRVAAAQRPVLGSRSAQGSDARFHILRPHASGGLGEVFIARDTELNRDVALKEIHARLADNEEIRARFLLEAEITGGLEHPGIVPVYGMGQDATGRPFYAMRFIRGRSLRDAIRELHDRRTSGDAPEGWRLGLRRLLSAFIDVCNAVAYAHSRGILHRDLKPENVMLGRYGETLLVDWGLAKLLGQAEPYRPPDAEADMSIVSLLRPEAADGSTPTRYGAVVGTPAYMSPEQAAGFVDRLGITSDIYSLGATLYVLITGRGPFEAQSAEDIRLAVIAGRLRPPHQVNPRVPRPLAAICLKAMRLDPQERYQTAEELAADVEKWLADEPVSAWKEPMSLRTARWMRRHRTSVAGALSAIFVAVASLSVTVALLAAANERERTAKEAAITNEQEAERNLVRAVEQEQRAQENFALARSAVDSYLTQVSEDVDLKSHNLEALRKKLLGTAREFYEQFIQQEPRETALRADWAAAYLRLAVITAETGSKTDAVALAEKALGEFARLSSQFAGRDDYRLEATRIRTNLGKWSRDLGQADQARTLLESSLADIERQLAVAPQSRELRALKSDTQQILGLLDAKTNALDSAELWFQAAIDTGTPLVAEMPTEPNCRCQLAEAHLQLGMLYQKKSRYDDALAQFNSAYKIQQELVDEDRSVARHVSVLVDIADAIVALYGEQSGNLENAEKLRLTALDLHKTLANEHPGVVAYQRGLATSHADTALYYMGKGNYFVAEPHLQSAREILTRLVSLQPDVPAIRGDLGIVLFHLGSSLNQCFRPVDAVKAFEESANVRRALMKEFPTELAHQFNLAATCNELGRLHSSASRWDESEKMLNEALQLSENLVRDHGDVIEYRVQLATVLYNLGELDMSRAQPQLALDRFVSAAQTVEAHVQSADPNVWARVLLRSSCYGRAQALAQLQRYEEALAAWQRAVDVDGQCGANSIHDLLYVWRSELLARRDDRTAAAAAVEELAALAANDKTRLHGMAVICAGRLTAAESDSSLQPADRTRVTQHLVDAAILFLRRAHQAGFFESPWQIGFLQIDQRFRPLHERPELKQLIEEFHAQ